MNPPDQPDPKTPSPPRRPVARIAGRILLHAGFLLIAIGCLAAYEHLNVEGYRTASFVSLAAAAAFGFAPVRDILRIFFKVEGTTLHLVHALGGLALIGLPLAGVVSGGPVLTHAAMAPFAMMGAAQALMHQNRPRNAKQAEAMRRFALSLPEVAQFSSGKNLSSPQNALRAVSVLQDIIGKAQALGETELEGDPGFQSALRQVTARFGANLGLDAVDLSLRRLAANPATAGAVPKLRRELALARQAMAGRVASR